MWFLILVFGFNTNFGTPKAQVKLPNMELTDFDKNIEVYEYTDSVYDQSFAIFYKHRVRKTVHITDTITDDLGFSVRATADSISKNFADWKMTSKTKESDSTDSYHSCLEQGLCSWKKMFEKGNVVAFIEIIPLRVRNKFIVYIAIEDSKYKGMLGY
mgnify:CR=1 FL=1